MPENQENEKSIIELRRERRWVKEILRNKQGLSSRWFILTVVSFVLTCLAVITQDLNEVNTLFLISVCIFVFLFGLIMSVLDFLEKNKAAKIHTSSSGEPDDDKDTRDRYSESEMAKRLRS